MLGVIFSICFFIYLVIVASYKKAEGVVDGPSKVI